LKQHLIALPFFDAITLLASGCGEANPGRFPEPKDPGASRESLTPRIPLSEAKTAKLSEKAKAAIRAAEKIDPRGR
jgi:hypothetical protein